MASSVQNSTSNVLDVNTTTFMMINTTNKGILSSEDYSLKDVSDFLLTYYIWIIFAFGFPGNLISLSVIVRMSRYHVVTPLLYVGVLAVVDNSVIIMKIIGKQTVNKNIPVSEIGCQFLYFFGLVLVAYANWILVVISAERFTAVKTPFKVKLYWSVKRAVFIAVAVFLFLSVVHLHLFFTTTGTDRECTIRTEYESFYYPYWFLISSCLYSIFPATSLCVFNILIITLLKKHKAQSLCFLSESDASVVELRRRERQDRQMTVMLVTLAIVFIILTIPKCIFVISVNFVEGNKKQFFNTLTSCIADTSHAVNFYFYFVTGRKFREYVYGLLHCSVP